MIFDDQPSLDPAIWNAFEPTRRASASEIAEAVQSLSGHAVVGAMLDAANVAMVIVNPELQIVAANRVARELVRVGATAELVGQRFGEVFDCTNSHACPDGCGGSEPCAECGITAAVLESQARGAPREAECVLTSASGQGLEAIELHVRATPVRVGDTRLTAVALRDISDSKRREVLERVFVHDLRNTLTALIGWSETLADGASGAPGEAAPKIVMLARRLAREVEDYRLLVAVEADQFSPSYQAVDPAAVLGSLADAFAHHEVARDKRLVVDPCPGGGALETDPVVLGRILTNMVVNALEATAAGDAVRVGCRGDDATITFEVWNAGAIPGAVAARIFERSFSTKGGAGRGLGSYSMRLFGERCLGGRVWFASDAATGTTFYLELPRVPTS